MALDESEITGAVIRWTELLARTFVERYRADLLVIGRYGVRRASGGFLGSVAEFLLRNGSGPVLAVASEPESA